MNMGRFPPAGALAATYARFSTDQQNPKSADDQTAMLAGIAEKNGWSVVVSEKDEGLSGARGDREGFLRLSDAAHAKQFSVLMVEGLERLSRNRADLFALYDNVLKPNGISVFVARSNTIIDDMSMMFLVWKAQEDLVQLKQQVQRGQDAVIADNRMNGSIAYGYAKKHDETGRNGLRTIRWDEANIVIRIFKEFDAGRSPLQIAAGLNADGVPSPKGKTWNPGVIIGNARYGSGILRNRLYIGEFVWRRTQRQPDTKRNNRQFVRPGDKDRQTVTSHPELAFVDPDLFLAVQDRLAAGQVTQKSDVHKRRKPEYLFSGKIVCGLCGERYNVLSGSLGCVGRALKGNGCPNARRTKREDLEAAVLQGLEHRLLHEDLLDQVVSHYRAQAEQALSDQREAIRRATARISLLEARATNIRGQLSEMDGRSPAAAMLREDLNKAANDLEGARRTVRQREKRLPAPKSTSEIIASLKAAMPNLHKLLNQTDIEAVRAREKLRALFDEIIVQPYDDGHQDGRGAGPVVVTVVGWLGGLLEITEEPVGRVFLSREGTTTWQDDASLQFFYSVVIANERSAGAQQVAEDSTWIRRLLAKHPHSVPNRDLTQRFYDYAQDAGERRDLRLRRAVERLISRRQILRLKEGREVSYQSTDNARPGGEEWLRTVPVLFHVENCAQSGGAFPSVKIALDNQYVNPQDS